MVQGSGPHGVGTSRCESSTQAWVHRDSVRPAPSIEQWTLAPNEILRGALWFFPTPLTVQSRVIVTNDCRGLFRIREARDT